MKTMDELVLDRLIEEATRPTRAALIELQAELARTKQSLTERNSALIRETEWRQKLQREANEADVPISDLYKAAAKVWSSPLHPKLSGEFRDAIMALGKAMAASEKYIDCIPF